MNAFRRRLMVLAFVVAVVGSIGLAAPAQATPAPAPAPAQAMTATFGTSAPPHVIGCKVTPYTPVLAPLGVRAGGFVSCSGILDYRYFKFVLWRCYPGSQTCFNMGEISHIGAEPASKELEALFQCAAGTYSYHTEAYLEGFHHNWNYVHGNSPDRIITC